MRTCLLALLVVVGCKRDAGPAPEAAEATPTEAAANVRDADALWALAPPGARVSLVATPRALRLADGALASLRELLAVAPELSPLRRLVDDALAEELGAGATGLADLGLDVRRGAAAFVTERGPVVVVPIADRAKLHRVLGLADAGPDTLGPLTCKTIGGASVCAPTPALLDGLGAAHVPAAIAQLGARGDVELVARSGPLSVAAVGQLERGQVTVRGAAATPLPPAALGTPSIPRVVPGTTAAFALGDVRALFARLPTFVIAHAVTSEDLAASIAGPVTITIPVGATVPDLRLPLRDAGPATELVEHCADFIPAAMLVANAPADTCRISVPNYGMEVDLWVEGKEVRLGARRRPPTGAAAVPLTALGDELARQPWSLVMWGRGTMFGARGQGVLPMGSPAQQGQLIRALTLLNELGLGVRADRGRITFTLGIRTVWANPPDVVAKLFAIPVADILGGKPATATAIARAAPKSPFAADVAAGQGGLMVPTAALGMIAAVAIPAFMDYLKKSKVIEAELQLRRLEKAAKVAVATGGKLPAGMATLTPATGCCDAGGRCASTAADWDQPVWKALEFELTEPHLFRYSYASDGDSFTATAEGDLDCDGTPITYTLAGTMRGGQLETTLVRPSPNTD